MRRVPAMLIMEPEGNIEVFISRNFNIIIFVFMLFFTLSKIFLSKAQENQEMQESQVVIKTAVIVKKPPTPYPTKIDKKKSSARKNSLHLKSLSSLSKHTSTIGTAENPTIDGGVINSAGRVSVPNVDPIFVPNYVSNLIEPVKIPNSSVKSTYANEVQKPPAISNTAFRDDWANSQRVKTLLHSAAKDGKLAYVLSKAEEKSLPASVAIVPMVESNYQANVTSSKGAAGIWQLMPSTARDYGVTAKDRYDFKASTLAALNLLDDLHSQLGNWELAFAAYNAGTERVMTALQKNPTAKSVQELDLPKETKDYVLRIMAINNVLAAL